MPGQSFVGDTEYGNHVARRRRSAHDAPPANYIVQILLLLTQR
jgi:hypothetical protein